MGIYNHTFTIPNGTADSNELVLTEALMRRPVGLTIMAPTTLLETVVVQVAEVENGTWRNLMKEDGSDWEIPEGKAVQLPLLTAGSVRLHAESGNVAADRIFHSTGSKSV
jgi:hypothetical protein